MAWLEFLLPLIFLFPLGATAIVVLALRNLYDARIRSPFDAEPLRETGQGLRDRLDRAFASLFLNGALGPIIVMAPLVYGMGRMLFASRQDWIEWSLYGLLSTLLVMLFCFLLIRDYQRIRRLKLGLACELAVGQELERLVRPDAHPYHIFHDIPADTYTIDHVAVTPHGVFVVETRARTQPVDPRGVSQDRVVVERQRLRFPGWSERQPLLKTRQAVQWLRQWLSLECGTAVPVKGVLVLPGWEIDTSQADGDLLIVSGERLAEQLASLPLGAFSEEAHARALRALMQRATLVELQNLQAPSV